MLAPAAYVVPNRQRLERSSQTPPLWKDVMTTKRALLRMRTRPRLQDEKRMLSLGGFGRCCDYILFRREGRPTDRRKKAPRSV